MDVLLLNYSFEPLKIISWNKALTLFFRRKVDILEKYSHRIIRSSTKEFHMPSVVRLKRYIYLQKYSKLRLSKENIFFRDSYSCAYCKKHFSKKDLTLDHILPLSRGGTKSWENLITACKNCNNKKGNQVTLDRSVSHQAFEPSIQSFIQIRMNTHAIPKEWKLYLST